MHQITVLSFSLSLSLFPFLSHSIFLLPVRSSPFLWAVCFVFWEGPETVFRSGRTLSSIFFSAQTFFPLINYSFFTSCEVSFLVGLLHFMLMLMYRSYWGLLIYFDTWLLGQKTGRIFLTVLQSILGLISYSYPIL